VEHWYVYYKLAPAERDAMREPVQRLQEQVARESGARTRLLQRTDQGEAGMTTVMEVYEDIEDAGRFARQLDAAVRAHLPGTHVAARRVERFRDA
jgi:predicted translin family RNA/ssDNA-binding protein